MMILGIDPGPEVHGYVVLDALRWRVVAAGISGDMKMINGTALAAGVLEAVVEEIAPQGQVLSYALRNTILQRARIEDALTQRFKVHLVTRNQVRLLLLGRGNGTETQVNAALLARYCERHGCTNRHQLRGSLKTPGALWGVRSHVWAALALCEVVMSWQPQQEGAGALPLQT